MREVFFAYSDVLVKEEKSGLNRKLKAPFRIERDTLSGRHYPAELTALWVPCTRSDAGPESVFPVFLLRHSGVSNYSQTSKLGATCSPGP